MRSSTPNAFVLIETGFLPLKANIYGRHLNFFKRFHDAFSKQGIRERTMNDLDMNMSSYLKHYHELSRKYDNSIDIHNEHKQNLKISLINQAQIDGKSKSRTYLGINPNLLPSPFLNSHNTLVPIIIKFRLGTHYLPIET